MLDDHAKRIAARKEAEFRSEAQGPIFGLVLIIVMLIILLGAYFEAQPSAEERVRAETSRQQVACDNGDKKACEWLKTLSGK